MSRNGLHDRLIEECNAHKQCNQIYDMILFSPKCKAKFCRYIFYKKIITLTSLFLYILIPIIIYKINNTSASPCMFTSE